MKKALRAILDSPYLRLGVGLILVISGMAEVVSGIGDVTKPKVGVHHSVVIFGINEILGALLRIYTGLVKTDSALDTQQAG